MTKAKLTKEDRIKREKARLTRIFKDLSTERKDTVRSLVGNAAFMSVTLEDLQDTMNQAGVVSEYQNGENQWGTKKSPEVEVYNAMIKNHVSIIKQLCDLLPDGKPKEGTQDELMAFVKQGGR